MSNLKITGLKDGNTKLTVKNADAVSEISVEVVDEGFVFKEDKITILVGEFANIKVIDKNPESDRFGTISWEVDNKDIIEMKPDLESNLIYGSKAGTATITFKWTYEGKLVFTAEKALEVKDVEKTGIQEVYISASLTYGVVGASTYLNFMPYPSGSNVTSMEWIIKPEGLAVMEKGFLKCLKPGKLTIQLKADNILSNELPFEIKEVTEPAPESFNISLQADFGKTKDGHFIIVPTFMNNFVVKYKLPEGVDSIEKHLVLREPAENLEIDKVYSIQKDSSKINFLIKKTGRETLKFASAADSSVLYDFPIEVSSKSVKFYNAPDYWVKDKPYKITLLSPDEGKELEVLNIVAFDGKVDIKLIEGSTYEMILRESDSIVSDVSVLAKNKGEDNPFPGNLTIRKVETNLPDLKVIKELPEEVIIERGKRLTLNIKTEQKNVDFFWGQGVLGDLWVYEDLGKDTGESTLALDFTKYELGNRLIVQIKNRDTGSILNRVVNLIVIT